MPRQQNIFWFKWSPFLDKNTDRTSNKITIPIEVVQFWRQHNLVFETTIERRPLKIDSKGNAWIHLRDWDNFCRFVITTKTLYDNLRIATLRANVRRETRITAKQKNKKQ